MKERHNIQRDNSTAAVSVEAAEVAFAVAALLITVGGVLMSYSPLAQAYNLHLTAVILSQLVCAMNFRSWKMFVGVFLSASSTASDPANRVNAYKTFALAFLLKTAAILTAVIFLLREGSLGLVWFMAGFCAYLILGLIVLAVVHVIRLRRRAAK